MRSYKVLLNNLALQFEKKSVLFQIAEKNITQYREKIYVINGLLAKCMKSIFQIFSGLFCLTCKPDWENYISQNSANSFVIGIASNNCILISSECGEYLTQRKTLNNEIFYWIASIVDEVAGRIGVSSRILSTSNLTSNLTNENRTGRRGGSTGGQLSPQDSFIKTSRSSFSSIPLDLIGPRSASPSWHIVRGSLAFPNFANSNTSKAFQTSISSRSTPYQNSTIITEPGVRIEISKAARIEEFKKNYKYSPVFQKYLPVDLEFPEINIPMYSDPCIDNASCSEWLCSKLFEGIVPDASKLANPQDASRNTTSNFSYSIPSSFTLQFSNSGLDSSSEGIAICIVFLIVSKAFTQIFLFQHSLMT